MDKKVMNTMSLILFLALLFPFGLHAQDALDRHDGWMFKSQRGALAPTYNIDQQSDQGYRLQLAGDGKAHADGCWIKSFPIIDGKYMRFITEATYSDVDEPARSILSSIVWRNDEGKKVSPTEYPQVTDQSEPGKMHMRQVYQVPSEATIAEVSLIYRWDANGKVAFTPARLESVPEMPKRLVKLAAVHHQPRNSTTEKNIEAFSAYAAEAGEKGADIVCLPEGITLVGTGQVYTDVAESLPGPTSNHLGAIARKHQMYIVAGILE